MKKNNQLHIFIETRLLNALKKEADDEGISLSELSRSKLRKKTLDRILQFLYTFPTKIQIYGGLRR